MKMHVPLRLFDSSKLLSWLIAAKVAERIKADPAAVARMEIEIAAWQGDPSRTLALRTWSRLVKLDPKEIAVRLLADNHEGELARDTMPRTIVPDLSKPEDRKELLRERSRMEQDGEVAYGWGEPSPT